MRAGKPGRAGKAGKARKAGRANRPGKAGGAGRPGRATLAVSQPPSDRDPQFEAMAITVQPTPAEPAARVVARLARKLRLSSWQVDLVDPDTNAYELVPPARSRPTPKQAWELTYRLREQPDVVHAEPLFAYNVSDEHRPRLRSLGDHDDPKTASNCEWSLEKARVIEAWSLFNGRPPGAGVTVGHPDTGCTPHPEIADPARLLVDQGFDFDDDDPDPTDDLDGQFMDNPGHGTSTGSVIVSNRGGDPNPSAVEFVSGVAPSASLIPIRTTESVVLFSMRSLRQAIDHAVSKGCQVISMSLGGPTPSLALRAAVRRAVDAGTIVLAAAGNYVRIVVFPAAFDDVIAVAASNVLDKTWSGSCQGDAVDITAPGEMVWHAKVERDGASGFRFSVERSSGTSYAVATAAGVAALWVSLHGWTALSRRYGVANISRVFKTLLQRTCRTPKGWDTKNFGPGIVDAHALLSAPLPDAAPARKLRDPRRAAVAADATGLEAILHLVPAASRANVEQAVAQMLGVPDRELPRVLQDVGDEFAFQLAMQPALRDELERRSMGQPAAKSRGARRRAAPVANPQLMSSRLTRKMVAGTV